MSASITPEKTGATGEPVAPATPASLPVAAPGTRPDAAQLATLAADIKRWGAALGFAEVGISDVDLSAAEAPLLQWLAAGFHGEMDYMARHGLRRARPAELVPGTVRVISARMDYLPTTGGAFVEAGWQLLHDARRANVAAYARGRDYHKVLRSRLQRLAEHIAAAVGPFGHRVFTDSAPVLEVELAQRAGLGWRGKHTLLLSRQGGSAFFLGELFVDLALPVDAPEGEHCGSCTACIDVCPTGAITAPYRLDARRCISYLTIELQGAIPLELRALIGNRIYGCDDCQLTCPWNKFAQQSPLPDFASRGLEENSLLELFAWDEAEFLRRTEGSAMRRIGHEAWLRNIAVALGNALRGGVPAPEDAALRSVLTRRLPQVSPLVGEHIEWALAQGATGETPRQA